MDFKKRRTWNLDSGLSIREALMKKITNILREVSLTQNYAKVN